MVKVINFLMVIALTMLVQTGFAQNAAESAKNSSGKDMAGVIASIIGAATMAPPCMATPPCTACCVMMAQALAQIPASSGSSSGANQAGNAMSVQTSSQGSVAMPSGQALPPGLSPEIVDQYNKTTQQVEDSGISINGDKVTMPNGKSYSVNSDTSPSGLASMGFPKSEIDQASKLISKINDEAGKIGIPAAGEGAGSGGSGTVASGSSSPSRQPSSYGKKYKRSSPSLAGLAKKIGDDRVGVSADNIFKMITRRYKTEDSTRKFMPK